MPIVVLAFATFAVAATAVPERTTAGPAFKVVGKWGGNGTSPGKFGGAANGLAIDAAGNVYVADSNAHRIQVFSSTGAFKQVLDLGAGLSVPDVAVGPDGDVWGTTNVNSEARRFPKSGGAAENFKTPKSADGVAVDADGNVYVSTSGDNTAAVVRFDKTSTGWAAARTWVGSGFEWPIDVETSPDGSIYVADTKGAPPNVKRYDASGRLLNRINMNMQATAGAGVTLGIGVDLDCNVWTTNAPQRYVALYSPSGKLLTTATSGDMVATDVAVGPTGDLYVFDINAPFSVVHFAEDRSKPAAAAVGAVSVAKKGAGWVARLKYTLSGVACPAQVDATASLAGKGVTGKAAVKVAAGKATAIEIPLAKGALAKVAGKTAKATFKIVLKTNGRPTTQTRAVTVRVPRLK
jgi:sugar lactone lactonase YvrE